MMNEQVQLDTFKPPLHNLYLEVKHSQDKLLQSFKFQFANDKQVLAQPVCPKWK